MPLPDLFCLALLGKFQGYCPGYSKALVDYLNYLSWTVIKGHTDNRAGEVTLASADPRDPPSINFRYFDEGSDVERRDLDAVVAAVKLVRELARGVQRAGLIGEEEVPGSHIKTDGDLRDFVRSNAWGHHASCTCPIGPREEGGVLGSDFRVHGAAGLRVVDASVFPRIPGFFIASAIYMIGEKAADVILADAARR
jgi:choline dehydrogenase-like flavoprotein